jgi:hypothetical protein
VNNWPSLPLEEWRDTYETFHRFLQIIGKTCLALAPFENHWWHCAMRVTPRGLRTPPLFHGERTIEIDFDLIGSTLDVHSSDGRSGSIALRPRSVADFYAEYCALVSSMGFSHYIRPIPQEMSDTLRFDQDRLHSNYDIDAVQRCWQILRESDRLLENFRSNFYGKCSPSHFWWGGFDLACTRFSGRSAPVHPGGIPNLSDRVTREAYSHECISAGWWPGSEGGPVSEPAFYAYAYPEPAGCPTAKIRPAEASYHVALHEWILPYDAVRRAPDPDSMVLEFLESTYEVASTLGNWDPALVR